MTQLNQNPIWKNLQESQQRLQKTSMRQLFTEDTERFQKFSRENCGVFLDFSKNIIDENVFLQLLQLAKTQDLSAEIKRFFAGVAVNNTEQRPALHFALRQPFNKPLQINDPSVMANVEGVRQKMAEFVLQVQQQDYRSHTQAAITDIVNIGIGGSDLGPYLVTDALADYGNDKLKLHFVSNIDDQGIQSVLAKVNPEQVLFIVSSKSFTTIETLTNMQTAKAWLIEKLGSEAAWQKQAVAVTAKPDKALAAGFSEEQIFHIWDWVGGRYSVWSAIGLPIALKLGMENFREFLAGAHAMDEHFQQTEFENNLPVILGLLEIWYRNFWQTKSHAIVPYLNKLTQLPNYLQQLVMESNGKGINKKGEKLTYATSPVLWGSVGTNCQHSFMQLLHQGQDMIPVDFILASREGHSKQHQQILLANALGQSRVLMQGKTEQEALQELLNAGLDQTQAEQLAPHKSLLGNRPSNILLFEKLTPFILGTLISLYEHKVFTTAALWGINPFDQWGVEMGKTIAMQILPNLQRMESELNFDVSTNELIKKIKEGS